jgi:tRNA pseudouridine55 synthase
MATGVLVVLIGRAAKASEYVSHDVKSYSATLRLGLVTDTQDTSGTILSVTDPRCLPGQAAMEAILPRFRGEILQVPPMYSALKVGGQKLCDLARRGKVVEREARPVQIFSLDAVPGALPSDYVLSVTCGGGTYIRTLCADIGQALGCGGVMASLRRTQAGGFDLSDCLTLSALEAMEPAARPACLRPVEMLFSHLPRLTLSPFFTTLCRNGCPLYQYKLGTAFAPGTRVRLCDSQNRFFALGESRQTEEGLMLVMIKLLVL